MDILDSFVAFLATKTTDKKVLRLIERNLASFKREEAEKVSPYIRFSWDEETYRNNTFSFIQSVKIFREYLPGYDLRAAKELADKLRDHKRAEIVRPFDDVGNDITNPLRNALKRTGCCVTVEG